MADPERAFSFEELEGVTVSTLPGDRGADELRRALAAAEEARHAAIAEGHAAGYAAGLADAHAALGPASEALARAVEGLDAVQGELCDLAERRAVELALALAEKIVSESLSIRPELVLSVAAGTLRVAAERDHLVLEVSPEDVDLVRAASADLAARVGGIQRLEIVPERRIPRGGCVVRTLQGEIDGRVGEKLALARELLDEALNGG
jgi:flagellar assembly protein FliH